VEHKLGIFHLIRYVPDVLRNEPINIGIILYEADGDNPQVAVRMTQDWSRLRCICPDADIAYIESMQAEIAGMLQSRSDIDASIAYFKRQWTAPLEVVDGAGEIDQRGFMFTDFDKTVTQLIRMYLDPRPRALHHQAGTASQRIQP